VVGTVLLWIVTGFAALATVIAMATKGPQAGCFLLGTIIVAIAAVLFYAVVGSLADTLGLLVRIAGPLHLLGEPRPSVVHTWSTGRIRNGSRPAFPQVKSRIRGVGDTGFECATEVYVKIGHNVQDVL
jgi:hypothetical protein